MIHPLLYKMALVYRLIIHQSAVLAVENQENLSHITKENGDTIKTKMQGRKLHDGQPSILSTSEGKEDPLAKVSVNTRRQSEGILQVG